MSPKISVKRNALGKYRDLVVAIALFLILDLGVLVLSYFASTLIEADAARINTASELRMLSQQMTKALLTMKEEQRDQLPIQTSWAQLSEASQQFDRNIASLKNPPAQSMMAEQIGRLFGSAERMQQTAVLAEDVEKTWRPVAQALGPVLANASPPEELVAEAATKAVNRNIKLIGQAGDLSAYLEEGAVTRSKQLRTIQVIAIGLALLNFLFIVFKFIRRLKAGDTRADAALKETERILTTISEGLCLIDVQGKLSPQFSKSLPTMLGHQLKGGESLYELVRPMATEETIEALASFTELLFSGRVKPALIAQLNPMREVQLDIPGRGRRVLDFEFEPVHEGNTIPELLVSVHDVTERVRLEAELESTKVRARDEFNLVMSMLDQEPLLLEAFVMRARNGCEEINAKLREARPASGGYRSAIESAFRTIHRLKGEAFSLQLEAIGTTAHHFETELGRLQGKPGVRGDDLIPLSLHLKELVDSLDRVDGLLLRMQRLAAGKSGQPVASTDDAAGALLQSMHQLAERVAADCGKAVRLSCGSTQGLALDSALLDIIGGVLPQFIRNAVAHGIEAPPERVMLGKPVVGSIEVSLNRTEAGDLLLSIRDDGCGLSVAKLRRALLLAGRDPESVNQMSERQILMSIFDSGISTAKGVGLHAGRGVGLDAVREMLGNAGARLRVSTEPNAYTRFEIRFAAASSLVSSGSWAVA